MRISACLHCALGAALLPFLSSATQTPLEQPTATSTTLVDALNADPDYTSLLRLFQRTKLIPTLNRLNGSTLFAPTNDAIKKASLQDPLWLAAFQDTIELLADNVQEQLRQQLFYHLLNESLPSLPSSGNVPFYKTLLYPRKRLDPPSREPPPNPPWMPIPNGTLGCEPQRLRLAARESKAHVAVDAFGKGGVKIVKDGKNAGNGVIFGVDEVIVPPPDLGMS
jgi:solute carrier family 25 carnitine/acylcarnitine transporter 20/29